MRNLIMVFLLLVVGVCVLLIYRFLRPAAEEIAGTYVRANTSDIVSVADTIVLSRIDGSEMGSYRYERRVGIEYVQKDKPNSYKVTSGVGVYDKDRGAILVDETEKVFYIDPAKGTLHSGGNIYNRK
ncbi:hypothetical protein [Chitinophaga rhizosphaerae]|uniref:hypothetical protein n=1 Tax=Chitinophaga rhizosphaerae TaxID=1864947 RepID=UPI000F8131B7|nr:hypothetical protein [Chitinophaga rhizosphaerae]